MARRHSRPRAATTLTLQTVARQCSSCGGPLRADYRSHRTIVTLDGLLGLDVQVRRCQSAGCKLFYVPIRAEAEGRLVLPQHEFGLEVIALVGALRHAEHRSVPEIHAALRARGVDIAERTVTHLLHRYDELLSLSLTDTRRLRRITRRQGHVVLALDGLQPDVGHEVLWVVRDCVSGEILTARTMLSAREAELAPMLREVRKAVRVPIAGVVSDGQRSIRNAVASALPGVPHQLCHFHYLREAGRPVFEADRHAKKLLKKRVRGVRPIERAVEGKDDPVSQAVRGYCAAVRSALTDDGLPPLAASGLKLRRRLMGIRASLEKVSRKGGVSRSSSRA